MKNKCLVFIIFFLALATVQAQTTPHKKYEALQAGLQKGWGTFNHKSVLSHVLLPYGIALNLGIKKTSPGSADNYLEKVFISSRDVRPEMVIPGYHALDGSYTELTVTWQNIQFKIQSAVTDNGELLLLVTPISIAKDDITNVVLETGMLWNKPGYIKRAGKQLSILAGGKKVTVKSIGDFVEEYVASKTPYMSVRFNREVAFYTGRDKNIDDIRAIIKRSRQKLETEYATYGNQAATYAAIQNVLAWNIIYDAAKQRVIYPVSRIWNDNFGGQSVLFCWDTYFSAYMAGSMHKNLAYANAVEITKTVSGYGFVPNWAGSYGNGSFDRSQPPVGSLVLKELYRKYREKWLLEYVFDDLLTWNRWWEKARDNNGLLCWGSSPVAPPRKGDFATNEWQGAAYESGLDNSPMYDNIPFNKTTHLMELADVGLMSLYIMDCAALAEIATVLNKPHAVKELKSRETKYRNNMPQLWNEKAGIYMNRRTDTKEFSTRLSPTNFYPLLAKVPSQQQAERMVNEHLLNPEEFNGKWMLPSISMNDTSFKEQQYWRGRIWAPMNFLVYAGLKNYNLPEARKMLAQKSDKLLMENVKINGWIFENYNAMTGNVTDQKEGRKNGDNYYHWGALLGFIGLMESEHVDDFTKPIQ